VVENAGRRLAFFVPPDHPRLQIILAPLRHLLARERRLPLEVIDGAPAAASPYLDAFESLGRLVRDHRQIWLEAIQAR
jgi:hypothetical protein